MSNRLRIALAALIALVLLGSGSGAAYCKFGNVQCGIGELFASHQSATAHDAEMLQQLRDKEQGASSAVLAPGFHETIVARGFTLPTDFAFLSPTTIVVSEKEGPVLVWSERTRSSRTVLDLSQRIDTRLFRGVITVAVDPDYATNHFIYVLYVLKPKSTADEATTVARLSRFVLPPGGHARGERAILGSVTVPSCSAIPSARDCLPSDLDHDGAQIAFAPDKTMYIATGDGGGHDDQVEPSAFRAQDIDSLSGKVLHVDRDGHGLPGNPYWNGDATANRSKVWAIGLRNPFRLTLDPRTGVPLVGDVGVSRREEVDATPRGSNLGWPCWEADLRALTYRHTAFCSRFYAHPPSNLRAPLIVIPHVGSGSVTGGTFAPASFGASYRDSYLYGDWIHGWIRSAVIDAHDDHAGPITPFARREPGPGAIKIGPDGALYVLGLNSGDIRRVTRSQ